MVVGHPDVLFPQIVKQLRVRVPTHVAEKDSLSMVLLHRLDQQFRWLADATQRWRRQHRHHDTSLPDAQCGIGNRLQNSATSPRTFASAPASSFAAIPRSMND